MFVVVKKAHAYFVSDKENLIELIIKLVHYYLVVTSVPFVMLPRTEPLSIGYHMFPSLKKSDNAKLLNDCLLVDDHVRDIFK